jgi:hypothetical protein
MLDIFFFILIYVLSLIFISEFVKSRANAKGLNFAILLYHYHVLIGFYYGWFAKGTDTSFYWNLGDRFRVFGFDSWFDTYGTHNNFVFFLNYPFSKILGLDFWTGTFLYSSVSAWAFVLLFISGNEMFKMDKIRFLGFRIWPNILLLPSLHFWSSGIGKDSLVFLFLVMIFYGIRDMRKYFILVVISLLLLYHVRPHMAFILIISAGFMLFTGSKIHLSYKIVFFALFFFGLFIIYGEVLEFLKIDEINTENLEALFDKSSSNLSYGKSYVDMSSYPLPLKLFTFWFRPLFFDAHNFSSLLNSIENLICLMLAGRIFSLINPIKAYKVAPFHLKIMLWTFLIGSIAFASALSNFGIMVRMKNMTFVYFLFFLIYCYNEQAWKEKLLKYRRYQFALKRKAATRKI